MVALQLSYRAAHKKWQTNSRQTRRREEVRAIFTTGYAALRDAWRQYRFSRRSDSAGTRIDQQPVTGQHGCACGHALGDTGYFTSFEAAFASNVVQIERARCADVVPAPCWRRNPIRRLTEEQAPGSKSESCRTRGDASDSSCVSRAFHEDSAFFLVVPLRGPPRTRREACLVGYATCDDKSATRCALTLDRKIPCDRNCYVQWLQQRSPRW
ncbi:hypothetical protein SAMN02787142_0605 [Burkholderia sp. WP9]|nr:hypothetical protein SAMN02787142_0605 [Burkholderia sp. WP9]